jgi:hypothetical protein
MDKAKRKMKKKIASSMIAAMAETDADYAFIAKRLGDTPENIEKWLVGLIVGETRALDEVSDLMLAMGCEFSFGLQRYEEPVRPQMALGEAVKAQEAE